jgi:hypothetical protein
LLLRRAGGRTPSTQQDRSSFHHPHPYIILDRSGFRYSDIHSHIHIAAPHGFINPQPNPDLYFNGNDHEYSNRYSDPNNKHHSNTHQYSLHTTSYLYEYAHPLADLYFPSHPHQHNDPHYGTFSNPNSNHILNTNLNLNDNQHTWGA